VETALCVTLSNTLLGQDLDGCTLLKVYDLAEMRAKAAIKPKNCEPRAPYIIFIFYIFVQTILHNQKYFINEKTIFSRFGTSGNLHSNGSVEACRGTYYDLVG
jgi:hypothetical protein